MLSQIDTRQMKATFGDTNILLNSAWPFYSILLVKNIMSDGPVGPVEGWGLKGGWVTGIRKYPKQPQLLGTQIYYITQYGPFYSIFTSKIQLCRKDLSERVKRGGGLGDRH